MNFIFVVIFKFNIIVSIQRIIRLLPDISENETSSIESHY